VSKPNDHTIVFAGAGEREIQERGRYIRVIDAPVADIFLQLDGSGEIQRGAGAQVSDGDGFKRVRVRSAVAQTVRISISESPQEDNRQSVNVNATAQVEGATEVTSDPVVVIAAGAVAQLVAGDVDRLQVRVALPSSAAGPIWMGAAAVAASQGGLLEPGCVDYIDGEMALFARNPNGVAVSVSVMPLRRP
jgi:hypothetical protein